MTPVVLLSISFSLLFPKASSLRCYTDVGATKVEFHKFWEYPLYWSYFFSLQSLSVECGMSTGCLKIYKKAAQFDSGGVFIPPHKRSQDLQLFRGKLCVPCLYWFVCDMLPLALCDILLLVLCITLPCLFCIWHASAVVVGDMLLLLLWVTCFCCCCGRHDLTVVVGDMLLLLLWVT